MNKIQEIKNIVNVKYANDKKSLRIANRVIELAEKWCLENNLSVDNLDTSYKKSCSKYVKQQIKSDGPQRYGFLGTLLAAVAFQLLVAIIVKLIMDRLFDKK